MVVIAPRFSLSESLMDGWRYASKTTSTLTLCTPTYSTVDTTDSASCANVLLLPFILCTRPIPSLMQVGGVQIASAGDTFFSSSVARAALFVCRREPSAFASIHGSEPSGWVRSTFISHRSVSNGWARTSFMFTLLLSATRNIWLKRFRSAFRTIFWPLIRDVFVLIVEKFSVFAPSSCHGISWMVDHRLIWSI